MHRARIQSPTRSVSIHRLAIAACAVLASLVVLSIGANAQVFDESKIRGYDYTGAYGQFGVSVGEINFDDSSSDASHPHSRKGEASPTSASHSAGSTSARLCRIVSFMRGALGDGTLTERRRRH